ncbi:hypothetical protein MTP99_001483 [Tenebrio molitor]|nr:hypothetical protein MTP99_001483 [Tenebrio molitor]
MPKPLPKRSKEMIASLIEYFTKERDHGGPLLSLKSIQQRVADALKINLRTVSSVNNQVKAGIITGSSSKETNFSRVHKFIKQSFT